MIRDITSLVKAIKRPEFRHQENLFWLSHRAEDALILNLCRPISGIIAISYSQLIKEWESMGCNVLSDEKLNFLRKKTSSKDIANLSSANSFKTLTRNTDVYTYMSFNTNNNALSSYQPSSLVKVVQNLNNKKFQRIMFKKWQINTPEFSTDFFHLQSKLHKNYDTFIETPIIGSLGNGVVKFSGRPKISSTYQEKKEERLYSPYIEGISVNTFAIIIKDTLIMSFPSIQILGNPSSNADTEFTYCGNDFSGFSDFDLQDQKSLGQSLLKLGECLSGYGYRGPFGADWILDEHGKWWLIEVNPRMQGSTLPLTIFELYRGITPTCFYWFEHIGLIKSPLRKSYVCSDFLSRRILGGHVKFYAPCDVIKWNSKDLQINTKHHGHLYDCYMPIDGTRIQKDSHIFSLFSPSSGFSMQRNQLRKGYFSIEYKW